MDSIISLDQQYVAGTYARFPVELTSGKGSLVTDVNGKQYIDMGSGIAVTSFGIADDTWQQAVTAQLSKLQHTSNLYYTSPCALLAKALCEVARKYSADKKGPQCYTIITLVNSFHGRTLTTLAATGQEHYHELFQPLTPGFVHVEAGDIEGLKKTVAEIPTAGILFECVQGEGGVLPVSREFVEAAAQICAEQDIPLMIDEVQTGNGRSGMMYAYMNYGIHPDIVSTAKGLGGGLPIGATMLSEKVQDVLGHGDHGSTYGGNPVCCAGALSIVNRLDDAFMAEVKAKSEYIFRTLEGAPGVENVSGLGLMIGVKTIKPAKDVVAACMEKGVLCLTAKDKVRLLPALNIPMELLKQAVEVIKAACAEEE